MAKASCVPDPGSMIAGDALEKCIDPCTLVVLGATGDLSARKLIPALFNLYLMERLPDPFSIVGCGRTVMDNDQFRTKMAEALKDSDPSSSEKQTGYYEQAGVIRDMFRFYMRWSHSHLSSGENLFEICAGLWTSAIYP